ncbi:hypothetical protein Glove_322g11 [Diversispora epigaea]|uniref:Uncharacterized protein n=1 Tax=Diversispora epigaea TaxID=1348612 RepID=A0A397HN35_9GLOM|nr:hypothetical protein Glove_322g11 [Diversispora epigaea]
MGHNFTGDILGMLKTIDFKFHINTGLSGSLTFPSGDFISIVEYFSTFLQWLHLLTFIKSVKKGAILGWYNDLETLHSTPIIQNKLIGMKEFYNSINLFINVCSPFKTKDRVWFSQRDKGQYNIGKLTKEKSLKNTLVDNYITQHFIQVSRGLESTSVVRPCEKCPININPKGNDHRCLIAMNKTKDIRKMYQIINEERNENILYNNLIIDKDIESKDSSCKEFDEQYGMDLGWIIPELINPIENDIRFKYYANHFPLSTKVKLLAIIIALAVVPIGNIQWSKGKNIISRNAILHMVKDLNLTVQYHKVKIHSNDKYNEEADSLARITWNEIFSGKRIQINIQIFNTSIIIPLWRSLVLDVSIKDTF